VSCYSSTFAGSQSESQARFSSPILPLHPRERACPWNDCRAHDFLTATGLSECPNCHERKLPHRVCAKCGTYKGRAVVEVKEAS
jgi:large subunit ribosomal protein L32